MPGEDRFGPVKGRWGLRVLLVRHMREADRDRVSTWLARHGHRARWCSPLEGDPLPPPAEQDLVVVYGGIQSANDSERDPRLRREIDWIERWVSGGGAYLGLCLGGQLLARALGARVRRHPRGAHEIGFRPVRPCVGGGAFLRRELCVYQFHNEGFELPDGAALLAAGSDFPHQAFRHGAAAYGLQFHPEVTAAMVARWTASEPQLLGAPGADPRERQIADTATHGPPMGRWLGRFLSGLVRTVRAR